MKLMRLSRHAAGFAVLAIAVAMTGCASVAPAAKPSRTAVTVAPAASPTPTVRIPTTCGALADPARRESWFGSPASVRTDEATPMDSMHAASLRAVGGVGCVWSTGTCTAVSQLRITLVPDAVDAFREMVNASDPGTSTDTVGDASSYSCSSYETVWSCGGSMLVGPIWVDVWISTLAASPVDESVAGQRKQQALEHISESLRTAQPTGSQWEAPPVTIDGTSLCAADSARPWLMALGLTGPEQTGTGTGPQEEFLRQITHLHGCSWTDSVGTSGQLPSVIVDTMPGGARIVTSMDATAAPWEYATLEEAIEVPGLQATRIGCDPISCVALISVDGSAVSVSTSGISREQLVSSLTAMRAAA